MISPVFSSTVTPSGAFSPGVNFVPSGFSVGFPSLSLNSGAGTFTSSPGFPSPSSYSGVYLLASFSSYSAVTVNASVIAVVSSLSQPVNL